MGDYMFFMKKKPLVVNVYTFDKTIFDLYKPGLGTKFIPEGWKSLPKSYKDKVYQYHPTSTMHIDVPTAKTCDGIISMYSKSIIIPAWTDVKVEQTSDGQLLSHSPSGMGIVEAHHRQQVWDELYPGYQQVKLISPWLFEVEDDVKFLWTRCDWHNTERYSNTEIMSGMLDFKYQNSSHIQMFVKGSVDILAGDPLVQMFPLTERPIELKYHLKTGEEYQQILGTKVLKYKGNYKHRKAILQDKDKPKCPFGFGR